MGEIVMKEPCSDCGGDIVVITVMEMTRMGKKEIISHGICNKCMRVVIMPSVEVSEIRSLVKVV